MKIHVLTLFPTSFHCFTSHSMIKRAIEKKLISVEVHDLRAFATDRHKTCDDKPFGGGPGMLMKPEPIFKACAKLFPKRKASRKSKNFRFLYMSPQGETLTQKKAQELAKVKEIVILCGHYEGVDQRVIDRFVTDEISVGDYVLTGGELPAMVVIETAARFVKGVLGREESKEFETFSQNLLEYPHYTRPAEYQGLKVPQVLLSGDHKKIADWRQKMAYEKTVKRRPDLLEVKR